MKRSLLVYLSLLLLASSCSVQKRQHLNGYYIDWRNNDRNNAFSHKQVNQPIESVNYEQKSDEYFASNNENIVVEEIIRSEPNVAYSKNELPVKTENCDEITTKNGEQIKAKILEVGIEEIKYKLCSNLEGPTMVVRKSSVFMIKYANGEKQVFGNESQVTSKAQPKEKNTKGNATLGVLLIAGGLAMLVFGVAVLFGSYLMFAAALIGLVGIILGIVVLLKS